MTATALLETKGLTMRFGGVVAVDHVDFTLQEVELRCVIGPNGAGKSTFFKCLTGQLRPTAGQVLFRGAPVGRIGTHAIARLGVGIKTQVPNVFDGLTARDNVWTAATKVAPGRIAERRTDEAMERVGIAGIADRIVGQLAHGQRQLVELAMVIAPEPDLILLDEPAAGMTDEEVDRLVDLIAELNQRHALVVQILHRNIRSRLARFHHHDPHRRTGMNTRSLIRDVHHNRRRNHNRQNQNCLLHTSRISIL